MEVVHGRQDFPPPAKRPKNERVLSTDAKNRRVEVIKTFGCDARNDFRSPSEAYGILM